MATWPVSLPQKSQTDGYRESPVSSVLRTSVDVGAPKQRRRYSASVKTLAISILVTTDQIDTFEDFVRDDLQGGSLEFDWIHPRTEDPISARIINGDYSISNAGGPNYFINFSIEILP